MYTFIWSYAKSMEAFSVTALMLERICQLKMNAM